MKKSLLFVLFLLLSISSYAQSPDKALKAAVKALGGEKAIRNIKSTDVSGTITRKSDSTSGKFSSSTALPNLFVAAWDLRGLETAYGYNGRSSWYRDSRDGLRTLTGQASREFQAEALYHNTRWLDAKKDKARLNYTGKADINGKPADVVQLTTVRNVVIKIYLDSTSGLPLREEFPAGDSPRILDYADYRPIDGVQEPHQITLTTGGESYVIKLEKLVHNQPVRKELFDFPRISNQPLPEPVALLKAVKDNEDKIDELLEKYTYTERETQRELDSNGQLKEKTVETYELTFYKGNRIRRLVAKNDKPLSKSDQENEDKRIEKRIRNLEKKESEKEKKAAKSGGPPEAEGQRISISDVLRASRLVNPRRERFRNRDCIVFDFEPLPGYKPQKDYEKFFGKTAGAIWIDEADTQVARVEARLIEAYKVGGGLLASLKEGASFVLEQDRVNNEIWLPTRAEINLSVKVLLVKGFSANALIEYGNYKRFNVDSEKEKLKAPDKP